ncbi:prepilin peptidase [Modestobacter marinus]|uniref:prepilin peptidase n=1 Tax=Modestobacter marinus TaxID=477641 RepID=UPI0027E02E6F|nr:A24 family peptidase [Modestobacter marinus]
MPLLLLPVAAALGLGAGVLVNRVAGRFPWPVPVMPRELVGPGAAAVRPPVVELATAAAFLLVALRFGASAEVPAFLVLATAAVLLAVVDARHRLLPDRVVLPTLAAGTVLLACAAAATGDWPALLRALLGAAAMFAGFLVLAVLSPSGLGMGDVKLAAVLGLYLGWLGWTPLLTGALAAFAVQAVAVLVLLAAGRVRRDGDLPFGPAMLAGAALGMALPLS